MKSALSVCLVLVFFLACNHPSHPPQNVKDYYLLDQEITQLDDNDKIRKYWEEIGHLDQTYRNEEPMIVQHYGYDSKEHKEIAQKINEADELNRAKVERMLAKFGYPRADSMGSMAASAPFMVIHHTKDYAMKERHFHYLYEAFKSGHLKEGPFSLYLIDMYKLKMGKNYEVGDVFREEDRINGIIEELGLK